MDLVEEHERSDHMDSRQREHLVQDECMSLAAHQPSYIISYTVLQYSTKETTEDEDGYTWRVRSSNQ